MIDKLDLQHVGGDAEVWEKVAGKFRTHEMPPPGAPRPDKATYDAVTAHLERELDAAIAAKPNPGHVPVHRLNRTEYTNAIRDLLGLKIDGESLLIADEPDKQGFENIAGLLSVSPSRLERYLAAARKISRLAVGDPTINPIVETYTIHAGLVQDDRVSEDLPFGTQGGMSIDHSFPIDAEYSIKILLKRQVYLYIMGMGEAHELDVRVDGVRVKRFSVGGEGQGDDRAGELCRQHPGRSSLGRVHAHRGCAPRGAGAGQGRCAKSRRLVRAPVLGARRHTQSASDRLCRRHQRELFRQPVGRKRVDRWSLQPGG